MGCLENVDLDSMHLDEKVIDLLILHSSYTEKFASKLSRVAKNMIVICGNVFCRDITIKIFLGELIERICKNKGIENSFETSLATVRYNKKYIKNRCCCFHPHDSTCLRKSIDKFSDAEAFGRYHKKCHLHNLCTCPKANERLHLKDCLNTTHRNVDFPATERDGMMYYCCCPQVADHFLATEGHDIHSLSEKFKLECFEKVKFNLESGLPVCDFESTFFV